MTYSEGRAIHSHTTKNKVVAQKWRDLPEDEKATYFERSSVGPSESSCTPESSWKEASRILKNFESNVSLLTDS